MKDFWIAAAAVLCLLELFAAGTAAMAKKCGEKRWGTAFIPVYSFAVLQRLTGTFTVLSIPMKKYGSYVAILAAVSVVAGLLAVWSGTLPEPSRTGLWQIMLLPLAASAVLFYLAALKAAFKMYRRFSARHYRLWCVLSLLLVTIPFLMAGLSRNTVRALEDIY